METRTYLRQRRLLLILDNFEQLLVAIDTILALFAHALSLTVLITSRARLNLRGETVVTLPKLALPSAPVEGPTGGTSPKALSSAVDEARQQSEAITMFVQRAQCFDPAFIRNAENLGPITQICHLADGLLLSIELATSMLPC